TSDRVEDLKQQRPKKFLRRDRRPSDLGIEPGELGRKLNQDGVHHFPNRTKGMVLRHSFLRRDVAENVFLVQVVSAHRGLLRENRRHGTPGINMMSRKLEGFSATC